MRALRETVIIAAAAGVSYAAVGSVISTFRLSSYTPYYATGVYRDAAYVYGVMHWDPGPDYLHKFTVAGSFVDSVLLQGTKRPYGADHCHLGGGYVCIIDPGLGGIHSATLMIVRKATGERVTSFTVVSGWWPRTVMWDGRHYYAASVDAQGEFALYTSAGSRVGTWKARGWPGTMTCTGALAYANVANYKSGRYLVASSEMKGEPSCIIDMADGSLVATFGTPFIGTWGGVVGDSSQPRTYGGAYWICKNVYGGDRYCVEIDIDARGAASVVPASVGKVKAIYR